MSQHLISAQLRPRRRTIRHVLEAGDPQACRDREKWRPSLAAVGAAIQFVKDTGRFEEEAVERS